MQFDLTVFEKSYGQFLLRIFHKKKEFVVGGDLVCILNYLLCILLSFQKEHHGRFIIGEEHVHPHDRESMFYLLHVLQITITQ